jgi:CheY-like chemotaxis protein
VDDDSTTRKIHRAELSSQFDVETANSGEQALQICKKYLPDLVLLDVIMPDMDGYETCKLIREFSDIPIIFVTATESLEEHMKAFDVGGDDIILKPVVREILLRKVSLAINRKNEQHKLKSEKNSLHTIAMNFLSAVGENGVLRKFMQASLTCSSPKDLGTHLVEAIKDFGLDNSILIRGDGDITILTSHGEPSTIEKSILEKSISMGRIFQFKQRLVVNYDRVSVIVTNMPPEDTEQSGRIRDNIAMLVEMTETMCENVDMRQSSMSRAEHMQVALQTAYQETASLNEMRHLAQVDLRLLLQELVDNVEKTYTWLGTSRSQENSLSQTMYGSVEKILNVLETSGDSYDKGFERILSALCAKDLGGEIQLF